MAWLNVHESHTDIGGSVVVYSFDRKIPVHVRIRHMIILVIQSLYSIVGQIM